MGYEGDTNVTEKQLEESESAITTAMEPGMQ